MNVWVRMRLTRWSISIEVPGGHTVCISAFQSSSRPPQLFPLAGLFAGSAEASSPPIANALPLSIGAWKDEIVFVLCGVIFSVVLDHIEGLRN
jgi:hypothetical protein